jgi:hypothetical protein
MEDEKVDVSIDACDHDGAHCIIPDVQYVPQIEHLLVSAFLPRTAQPAVQEEFFLVKFTSMAFMHSYWLPKRVISHAFNGGLGRVERFRVAMQSGSGLPAAVRAAMADGGMIKQGYLVIGKIIAHHVMAASQTNMVAPAHPESRPYIPAPARAVANGGVVPLDAQETATFSRMRYLCKWFDLPADQYSWESFATVVQQADAPDLLRAHFLQHSRTSVGRGSLRGRASLPAFDGSTRFLRGQQLRPFQVVGVNWLIDKYKSAENCILADEMGLGKTIQVRASCWPFNLLAHLIQTRLSSFLNRTLTFARRRSALWATWWRVVASGPSSSLYRSSRSDSGRPHFRVSRHSTWSRIMEGRRRARFCERSSCITAM